MILVKPVSLSHPPALLSVAKRKRLKQQGKGLVAQGMYNRARPETCFLLLGVPSYMLAPIMPQTFNHARQLWLEKVSEARVNQDSSEETMLNLAWSRLKDWRCSFCGGLKQRTRNETCSDRNCNTRARVAGARRKRPLVLKMHRRSKKGTVSVLGNGLRDAQASALKHAILESEGNLSEAARRLNMSYQTLKYYMRKFGFHSKKAVDLSAS